MRIQSEGFELSAPFRGSVAESLHTNAAGQTTFDCCFDEVRCQECKRDGQIDLSRAAFLACGDLLNVGHGARHDLVKPATTSGDGVNKTRSPFDTCCANVISGNADRDEDLSGFPGRRFPPRDRRCSQRRPDPMSALQVESLFLESMGGRPRQPVD